MIKPEKGDLNTLYNIIKVFTDLEGEIGLYKNRIQGKVNLQLTKTEIEYNKPIISEESNNFKDNIYLYESEIKTLVSNIEDIKLRNDLKDSLKKLNELITALSSMTNIIEKLFPKKEFNSFDIIRKQIKNIRTNNIMVPFEILRDQTNNKK